jgi:hypothetical protein
LRNERSFNGEENEVGVSDSDRGAHSCTCELEVDDVFELAEVVAEDPFQKVQYEVDERRGGEPDVSEESPHR